MSEVTVHDVPERHRYEAVLDGQVAGYAEYERSPGEIVFTHTVVDDAHEGKGVGSALARAALDDVRATGGLRVVPRCPFIARWIERHPDYAGLVQPTP